MFGSELSQSSRLLLRGQSISLLITILASCFAYTKAFPVQTQTSSLEGWIVVKDICVDQDISPEEAFKKARHSAHDRAIEQVCGRSPSTFTFSENGEYFNQATAQFSTGIILKDSTLSSSIEPLDIHLRDYPIPLIVYTVEIACSVACPFSRDEETLQLTARLDAYTYRNGDPITLSVIASEDCFLTVFALGADRSLAILYPNERLDTLRLTANEAMKIPDTNNPLDNCCQLVAHTLHGSISDIECIWVVASKEFKPFLGGVGRGRIERRTIAPETEVMCIVDPDAAIREFSDWCNALPISAFRTVSYRVIAR